ncbi:toll-like receptor 13 [Bombina bombina]|uniref:toll-like receptor 13 n=1 Tax=Bombina bombina TaxID=8345 RepID=UPI00235A6A97|nr:toll-like receptor 13 [Bombina bombina]
MHCIDLELKIIVTALITFLLYSAEKGESYALQGCEVHGKYNLKVLCYNKRLTHVPEQLPMGTFNLDISHNRIKRLTIADFRNVTQMQIMNASANQISFIENGTFQNLEALQLLNLRINQLKSITSDMFKGLKNITTLLLDTNLIATIEPNAFSSLPKLKILGLSSNKLYTTKVINYFFQINRLSELYIGNNNLKTFSTGDIVNASSFLRTIDVSRNPFFFIGFITSNLQNITSLDISFLPQTVSWNIKEPCFLKGLKRLNMNGILLNHTAISNVIQSLSCSSLEELNLSYLNLTDSDPLIPQICHWHPKIQILNLQGNNYTQFKVDTFQNCTFLQYLDLSHNKFQRFTASTFQHLSSLKQLSIANNELNVMPNDLSNLASLERLNLSYNHLSDVHLNESKSYNTLKDLDLSGNIISVFSTSALGNLSLQNLYLGENHLLDISNSFAYSLRKLKNLQIRKNKLDSITLNTFKNLESLENLNLVDNQIETIDEGAFNGLVNLKVLLLGSNKIKSNVFQKGTFQGLRSLVELQLFSNYIEYDSSEKLNIAPFHQLSSLKLITLNSQGSSGMRNFPVNLLEGLVSLEKIHAGNLALNSFESKTFSYIPQLKELDISNNPVEILDPLLLKPLLNLTELHVNQMHLDSLDFLNISYYPNLTLLRASGNQLNLLTSKQLGALPALRFLDLRNNKLTCSCDNQWFIDWALNDVNTQVLYFFEYKCAYPPSSKGTNLHDFNISSCRLNYSFIMFLSTTIFISTLMISLTIFNFCRWQVVYAYYIFLAFLYDKKYQKRKPKYQYDAFISFNNHDEEWVFKHLVPNLEDKYKWKLCLHHRDFEPGKPILDNVIDSIYSSRKTVCIISTYYLESEWCSKELQVASYRLFDEHADVLILLFLEDIPSYKLSPYHKMRKFIKKKTYLLWPKDINAAPVFWCKVNQALETIDCKEDDCNLMSGACA